ncbi:MAG: YkgJ family cysteine cluster protein [Desulfonatronovibrio sp.]
MSANDDYICLKCSRVNPTCCVLAPGQEKSFFPLSNPEIKVISAYLETDDFFVRQINDPDFIARLFRIIPRPRKLIRRGFPLGNFHSRLKTDNNGRCVLLTRQGCVLPGAIRPVYCRLYPFWFKNNKLAWLNDPLCLAQDKTDNIRGLLRLFGMEPLKLKQDFDLMLYNLGLGDPDMLD